MIFAVIVCVIGLISAILVGKLMGFNGGQAGGLAACALTQSSVIGVAQDAISKMDISNQKQMMDFVPVGYAVTYIFGTLGCTFILTTFGPKILGVDLEKDVLGQMEFRPAIAEDLKLMDARLFTDEIMGLKA